MSFANLLVQGYQVDQTADSTFNLNASTMVKLRTALSLASAKLCPILIAGDSTSSGYQVVGNESPDTSWPGILRNALITLGVGDGGKIVPTADYTHAPDWTYDIHWSQAVTFFFSTAANAVATYVSTNRGGRVTVWYSDLSAPFSFTIDGGAANNVVPGGTTTVKSFTVTGQTNTVHTVAITASAANVYIIGCQVNGASGIVLCNFAEAGSGVVNGYANAPGTSGNWSSTAVNSLGWIRQQQMFNALTGARPEGTYSQGIGLLCVGVNDMANGATTAQVIAGYRAVIAQSPNLAWAMVQQYRSPVYNDTVQAQIRAAAQTFALQQGIPIFDWDQRLGGYAKMLAAGLLQSDNAHPTNASCYDLGTSMAYQMLT